MEAPLTKAELRDHRDRAQAVIKLSQKARSSLLAASLALTDLADALDLLERSKAYDERRWEALLNNSGSLQRSIPKIPKNGLKQCRRAHMTLSRELKRMADRTDFEEGILKSLDGHARFIQSNEKSTLRQNKEIHEKIRRAEAEVKRQKPRDQEQYQRSVRELSSHTMELERLRKNHTNALIAEEVRRVSEMRSLCGMVVASHQDSLKSATAHLKEYWVAITSNDPSEALVSDIINVNNSIKPADGGSQQNGGATSQSGADERKNFLKINLGAPLFAAIGDRFDSRRNFSSKSPTNLSPLTSYRGVAIQHPIQNLSSPQSARPPVRRGSLDSLADSVRSSVNGAIGNSVSGTLPMPERQHFFTIERSANLTPSIAAPVSATQSQSATPLIAARSSSLAIEEASARLNSSAPLPTKQELRDAVRKSLASSAKTGFSSDVVRNVESEFVLSADSGATFGPLDVPNASLSSVSNTPTPPPSSRPAAPEPFDSPVTGPSDLVASMATIFAPIDIKSDPVVKLSVTAPVPNESATDLSSAKQTPALTPSNDGKKSPTVPPPPLPPTSTKPISGSLTPPIMKRTQSAAVPVSATTPIPPSPSPASVKGNSTTAAPPLSPSPVAIATEAAKKIVWGFRKTQQVTPNQQPVSTIEPQRTLEAVKPPTKDAVGTKNGENPVATTTERPRSLVRSASQPSLTSALSFGLKKPETTDESAPATSHDGGSDTSASGAKGSPAPGVASNLASPSDDKTTKVKKRVHFTDPVRPMVEVAVYNWNSPLRRLREGASTDDDDYDDEDDYDEDKDVWGSEDEDPYEDGDDDNDDATELDIIEEPRRLSDPVSSGSTTIGAMYPKLFKAESPAVADAEVVRSGTSPPVQGSASSYADLKGGIPVVVFPPQADVESQAGTVIGSNNGNGGPSGVEMVIALHSFAARSAKEMSLARGDIVLVHKRQGTWIYGTKRRKEEPSNQRIRPELDTKAGGKTLKDRLFGPSASSSSPTPANIQSASADIKPEVGWIPQAFVTKFVYQ